MSDNLIARNEIHRSKESRVLAGVLGGLGEKYDINPNWLRVGLVAIVALTVVSIPFAAILYIIAALVIPEKD